MLSNTKSVYTLNCQLSKCPLNKMKVKDGEEYQMKKEIDKLLKQGYAVRVGATCIGHTLSWIVENSGAEYIQANYEVEEVVDCWTYYKLVNHA